MNPSTLEQRIFNKLLVSLGLIARGKDAFAVKPTLFTEISLDEKGSRFFSVGYTRYPESSNKKLIYKVRISPSFDSTKFKLKVLELVSDVDFIRELEGTTK